MAEGQAGVAWVCNHTNMKKDIIQLAIGIVAILSILLGAMNYFAKADDLKLVELRLDQKIVSDRIQQTQQRIWQLEDRHGGKPCGEWSTPTDRDEYRKLKEEVERMKREQELLMRKR